MKSKKYGKARVRISEEAMSEILKTLFVPEEYRDRVEVSRIFDSPEWAGYSLVLREPVEETEPKWLPLTPEGQEIPFITITLNGLELIAMEEPFNDFIKRRVEEIQDELYL